MESKDKNTSSPPRLATRFLHWFLKEELEEEVTGDLKEQYLVRIQETSRRQAQWHYWHQVFQYLRPFAIKKINLIPSNPFYMFRHNFKIAFRNIYRNTSAFLINLIGLSTGLVCVLLIALWIFDEWKVDKFHILDDRLYQVFENQKQNNEIFTTTSTPWLLAETLVNTMPEVEFAAVATPSYWFEGLTLSLDEKTIRATGQYVSADYFNIFSYDLVQGNKATLLKDKSSIVISKTIAEKLFGAADLAIGKKLKFQQDQEFYISGIFKDIPRQSSYQFDFALSVDLLKEERPQSFDWKNAGPDTFIVLKEGSDLKQFNKKIKNLIGTKTDADHRKLIAAKYSDQYLYGNYENGVSVGGRIDNLQLFSIIAIFILLIACINFMNLSTAKASGRLKEIGVKKAVGAYRHHLVSQFLGESMLISSIALILAFGVSYLLLPQFNLITGKELSLAINPVWILFALGITIVTGFIAGSYPALYISGFRPVDIFKGKTSNSFGALWARKGLVIFQFILSVSFIALVFVLYQQISFVQNKNLGYNKDNILYFDIEGKTRQNLETFISELKNIPGVVNASSASESIISSGNTMGIEWEGKDPNLILPFRIRAANYDLIDMLDFELTLGRGFPKDQAKAGDIIFNESGIQAMGMEDPIGKVVQVGPFSTTIRGVIKDFHFQSLHSEISPLFFLFDPEYTRKIMVKIVAGKETSTLAQIQEFYGEFNPGFDFNYRFLDNDYQSLYIAEQRIASLSRYFAGLAIIISCLGLFGLAAFTVQRRRKEISIRKVLGASNFSVLRLLGNDFFNMVLIAIIIALPLSYFLSKSWLENFAFKIELKAWFFVAAGLLSLLIAWLTVGLQTFRASSVNPAEVLKSE